MVESARDFAGSNPKVRDTLDVAEDALAGLAERAGNLSALASRLEMVAKFGASWQAAALFGAVEFAEHPSMKSAFEVTGETAGVLGGEFLGGAVAASVVSTGAGVVLVVPIVAGSAAAGAAVGKRFGDKLYDKLDRKFHF